jgi:hypothetical protein
MGAFAMSEVGDPVLIFPLEGDKENLVAIDPSTSITTNIYNITEDHTFRGIYRSDQIAGEDIVFGEIANYKSDGKWWKTDANTMTMCIGEIGIALEDILADATGEIGKIVDVRDDSWSWTKGDMLYISETAGAMTNTMPTGGADQIRKVAVALSATLVSFAPDCTIIELA